MGCMAATRTSPVYHPSPRLNMRRGQKPFAKSDSRTMSELFREAFRS